MKSSTLKVFLTIISVIFVAVYLQPVTACVQQSPSELTLTDGVIRVELDEQVRLSMHQIAIIGSEDLRVELLDITEDSRCPSDVACIQAGQVTATFNLEVLRDGRANDYFISLIHSASQAELAFENFDGYSIQLINVEPYPISTEEIAISDYVVTIVVSKI
ncbi:MAG: hypothetical protein QNJ46_28095 [Leptolyngbyaceae cyanobacterium MO_188.B28]|nr:hypothetical protein [Leptolyngbyaceae cyanobacterium MO_188.B28]